MINDIIAQRSTTIDNGTIRKLDFTVILPINN